MMMQQLKKNRLMLLTGKLSVAVSFTFIMMKIMAFMLTDSIAVLSSLFDSVQDLLTSLVALTAIKQAVIPPDRHHRFGHGKAQAIGAMIQSFVIFAAAVVLLKESVVRLFHQQPITDVSQGIVLIGATIVISCFLVLFQRYAVKQTQALSLRADMLHYSGDILMNVGVVLSLIGASVLNWHWLDGFFGIIVSLILLRGVWVIARDSCRMLMDEEMPYRFRKDIRQMILSCKEVKKMADLRTRTSGSCVFVQFCIRLDSRCSLKNAHEITEMIEKKIKKRYPDTQISIYIKPFS